MRLEYFLISAYLALNIAVTVTAIFFTRKLFKKETFAIIQRKDGDNDRVKINPNKKSFDHKEMTYITPTVKTNLKFWCKHFILYDENNPFHVETTSTALHPKLSGEALYSVVYSEALKILNKPKGLLGGFDIKKIGIVLGVGVVIYLVLTGVFN